MAHAAHDTAVHGEQLRFVDADELRGWATTLEGVVVMSTTDEVLGGLDGLLVTADDRPMYLAIATSGEPTHRYLLPIGTTWFDETTGVIRTDANAKTLASSPEFEASRYRQMSSEESLEYERRVLRACCPETTLPPGGFAAPADGWKSGSRLEHYSRKEFADPGWLKRPNTTNRDTSRPER